jgi:putative addiction module killer protein
MLEKKQTTTFKKWLINLPDNVQDIVNDYIDRVIEGNTSNCKKLRKGISEIVINYQRVYIVYYTILQNKTILLLLSGGNKGGNQKEQNKDIEKAIMIKEYMKQQGGNMKKEKEIIDKTDWHIDKEDYDTTFAKIISKNPKRLKVFKKHIIEKYNKTKNLPIFLEDLKIIAVAEGNIAELARKSNMKRPNIYRVLSRDNNPTFEKVSIIAHNLGIDFVAKST